MRALPNRSEASTLLQIRDVEASLPFPLCGLDSDNGGEFITIIWSSICTGGKARGLHPLATVSQERPGTHRTEELHAGAFVVRV